jgi:hypothetical protein
MMHILPSSMMFTQFAYRLFNSADSHRSCFRHFCFVLYINQAIVEEAVYASLPPLLLLLLLRVAAILFYY